MATPALREEESDKEAQGEKAMKGQAKTQEGCNLRAGAPIPLMQAKKQEGEGAVDLQHSIQKVTPIVMKGRQEKRTRLRSG